MLSFVSIFRLLIFKPLFEKLSKNEILNRKVLIVGAGKSGKSLATKLLVEDFLGFEIIGFADDNVPKGTEIAKRIKVLGTVEEIINSDNHFDIDDVINSIDKISYEELIKMI